MGNFQHTENREESLKNKVLEVSSGFSVPKKTTLARAWEIFGKNVSETILQENEIRFDFRSYLKIAASLLLILLASFTLYVFQHVEISSEKAENKTVVLPDQSTVALNAGSKLEYNALLFHFTRKVKFSGEGFFKVRKGSTFEVASENGATKVLGTQFNVLARGKRYEVACVEGKVRVSTPNSSVILTAGVFTKSLQKKLQKPEPFKEEDIAWRNGEFYFESVSLDEVLKTLELQYNIRIKFQGNTQRLYTGYFTNQNLEEALKLVCLPLGLRYVTSGGNEIDIIENTLLGE